jgi:iron complex transport system substrate-binding protein
MDAPRLSRRASLALLLLAACKPSSASGEAGGTGGGGATTVGRRLVTVGGSLTEIAFALGVGGEIVGVDSSSTFPAEATKLPQVGYQRALSAEGVLALRPTLVLASQDAGPPAALEQIRSAGVAVQVIQAEPSAEGALAKIRRAAAALGRAAEGEALATRLDSALKEAQAQANGKPRLRVLCVYARGAGTVLISGKGSAAAAMVALAGAENAAPEIEGSKPLTPESALAARPDVLLATTHGIEGLGGVEALLRQPGLADTPAGKARRVVVLDDLLLLGFGPRTGEAVRRLIEELHRRG